MASVLNSVLNIFLITGAKSEDATIEKNASTTIFGRFMGSTNVYGAITKVTAITAISITFPKSFLLRVSNMHLEYLTTAIKAETRSPRDEGTGFRF